MSNTFTCKKCGTVFSSYKRRSFCSWVCYKKGAVAWNKGVSPSKETREKQSIARLGKKPWNKGTSGYKTKPASEERKLKCRESNLATYEKIKWRWQKENHPNWGKHMNVGSAHPAWIADRTKLAKRQIRNDYAYRDWRITVLKRDGFTCKINNQDCNGKLEVHHILSWFEYKELRYNTNNGITLCHTHHPRGKTREKQLATTFQELVESLT